MRKIALLMPLAALALAGCAGMTPDQRYATGALAGGAAGLAIADKSNGNNTEKAVGTLAGAAIGGTIAANSGTSAKQCQYADGTIRACPAGY